MRKSAIGIRKLCPRSCNDFSQHQDKSSKKQIRTESYINYHPKLYRKLRGSAHAEPRALIIDYFDTGATSVVGKTTLWTCVYIEVTFSVRS